MNIKLYDSWGSLQSNPTAVVEEICGRLQAAYEDTWLHNEVASTPGLQLPTVSDGMAPQLNVPRRWAVAENLDGKNLVYRMSRLIRHDNASFHPLAAGLAQCATYITIVEATVLKLATRLTPWFGQAPVGFDWVVSLAGAPVVPDLGYWLSTVQYALDESLTEHGQMLPSSSTQRDLPKFWLETAANAVKWELAVLYKLTVPGSYNPPAATRDQPYASFQNPFLPILDIWCSGAMLEAGFNGDIVTICIDSQLIPRCLQMACP
jgi:hypothetical protein